MRTILITRGTPGCGKSTWIKQNRLEPYSINYDKIRLLFSSPRLNLDGNIEINQSVNKRVFDFVNELIEQKMKNGEFIVLDGTHSRKKDFDFVRKMSKKYLYRIICVDFTDIPINIIKMRNNYREPYKKVSESVIEKFERRFADKENKIPSGIIVIKPSELDKIYFKPLDLSKYKKIHHFGDIHGCNTVLQEYLKNNIKDDEAYIFLGDYIDRGIENVEVLKFMMNIIDKPNVFCLEGNHERWLWKWSQGDTETSSTFKNITSYELEKAEISKKDVSRFYRKLIPCAYYTYGKKIVFVSHGGVSSLMTNPMFLSLEQIIKGVGKYQDTETVDIAFAKYAYDNDINLYQIHGHRNVNETPVVVPDTNGHCFNLEGQVEAGKYLRVIALSENGFETFEIKNNVFKKNPFDDTPKNQDLLSTLRQNPYVTEKVFGKISSFNFTRDAFYKEHWDKVTTKARGLYLDNITGEVVARSYDKFFNLEENEETSLKSLSKNLKFPVDVFIKENGYLGIVSVVNDELFITTKSNPDAEYAQNFKKLFYKLVKNPEKIKEYIKENNCSLVFEVIDTVNDPHIIEYKEDKIVLLDIISNDIKFERIPYSILVMTARDLGLKVKKLYKSLHSFEELNTFIDETKKEETYYPASLKALNHIEGFVLSDANDYQFKLKLNFYNKWKSLRTISQGILNKPDYEIPTKHELELDTESNKFIEWLKWNKFRLIKEGPTDIITLRNKFKKEN